MREATETIERALAATRRAGAEAADAILVEGDAVETRVHGDEIEFVKQARGRSLGIRAFVRANGGALSSATTSTGDLSDEAVDRMAAETVAIARAAAPDPAAGLPEDAFADDLPDLGLVDPDDHGLGVDARIARAREAEAAARASDERITNSEGSEFGSHFGRVALGNTSGFFGSYESASHSLFSMPIASQDGRMQTDSWVSAHRRLAGLEPAADVGRRAAARALRRLGARRVPTCEVPVIFEPTVARSLVSGLAGCLSGYAVYRGASFLANRVGEQIAAAAIDVVDDGRLPGELGSRPFDGEGLATRRTRLVEKGRLSSYLLDSYSARKLGLASTGNAARGTGGPPGVGVTNCWLEPGSSSLDEIVADTPRGLLVTSMFGHGFNPVTGDFSRGAAGLWIENGETTFPVEEVTVAGNLGQMLLDIDAIGDDLLRIGRIACPSLRIARMTVAGE